MKPIYTLLLLTAVASRSQAKVWRLNNNAGIVADFTTITAALGSANVHDGDTLYLEPSATDYATNSTTLAKRLTFIGPGYFFDPAAQLTPGNPGLQITTTDARIAFMRLGPASSGSKFMGVTFPGSLYAEGCSNITFEKVLLSSQFFFNTGAIDGLTFRKCFINQATVNSNTSPTTAPAITRLTIENCIFYNGTISLPNLSGTGNLFRNNSIYAGGGTYDIENCYIANNIFGVPVPMILTNCTVKNNLFQLNQTLPATATDNLVSVDMTTVYAGGAAGSTISLDNRAKLKDSSPARGKGLTVGSVVSPDCGAYGGTDPYVLSGIPNIPTIYSLTVPTSIPSGTATMNITFSTKNNN